jgi:hypothetical protein
MNAIAKALPVQDAADVAAYITTPVVRDDCRRIPESACQKAGADSDKSIAAHAWYSRATRSAVSPPVRPAMDRAATGMGRRRSPDNTPPTSNVQVAAFAQGLRHNDIYEIDARSCQTTDAEEMKAVAEFYGAQGRQLAAKNQITRTR